MSCKHAMIGKTEIGRKQLGLDENSFRALLEDVTGKSSRKDCSETDLARLIDRMAQCCAVFTSVKANGEYKTKAGQRRSDFYEIPATAPHAKQKRLICALWRDLGYDMTSLDTRVARQFGVATFLWCHDLSALQTLAKDLTVRLAAKQRKQKAMQAPSTAYA